MRFSCVYVTPLGWGTIIFMLVPLALWQAHEPSFSMQEGWGLTTNSESLVNTTLACHHTHISALCTYHFGC